MSLFGAVRLYVVSADRTVRDFALSDGDSMPPLREGAWALWAKLGDRTGEVDPWPWPLEWWEFERSVVILGDGVGGVAQDASRTVFARSTSFVA
jgi:hypothetical protein